MRLEPQLQLKHIIDNEIILDNESEQVIVLDGLQEEQTVPAISALDISLNDLSSTTEYNLLVQNTAERQIDSAYFILRIRKDGIDITDITSSSSVIGPYEKRAYCTVH